MLILSRKPGERIRIGDNITVLLVESSAGMARIGVVAPRTVGVHREEIYEKIQAAREEIRRHDPHRRVSDMEAFQWSKSHGS